jgi:S1-C subfamily serine protease
MDASRPAAGARRGAPGDVIHGVNASPIADVETLRALLGKLKHGDPVVLRSSARAGWSPSASR